MSLIPPFEIGLWNAWIFMAYSVVALVLPNLIFNRDNFKVEGPQSRMEKRLRTPWAILLFAVIIYSIFLPLERETIWFYAGLPICLLGAILYTITAVNMATTSLRDEPATSGVFRFSRHPMYLSTFLLLTGVGIASASWIILLLAFVSMTLWVPLSISEENYCLEIYGNAYRKYMNRTPRWIGIPKSEA
ncbi:methyltransferase family protein [Chloroflexota bacterium]